MRVEMHYFSDDDIEFDTEEECLNYENTKAQLFNTVAFFDENRNLMQNPSYEDIEGYAIYMVIKDAEKAEVLFRNLEKLIDFDPPSWHVECGDVLMWDSEPWGWVDMVKQMDKLHKDICKMLRIARGEGDPDGNK